MKLRLAFVVACALLSAAIASAQERTMVVYLPSTPVESASRVAAGITQLAAYLSERTGMRIEAKAFRRAEDAAAYVAGAPAELALVVAEQSFLLDLPQGATVGSASLRRQALIRRLRPDLNVIVFRGQVDTRLGKLAGGEAAGADGAVVFEEVGGEDLALAEVAGVSQEEGAAEGVVAVERL